MPVGLLLSYLVMMPRLEAEAQLTAIRIASIGQRVGPDEGGVEEEIRRLESIALAGQRPRRAARASLDDLEAAGITVIRESAVTNV